MNIRVNAITNRITVSRRWAVTLLLVFACFLGGIAIAQPILSRVLPQRRSWDFDIADRLTAISQMKLMPKTSLGESSIAGRLRNQKQYLSFIAKRPIFGYGFDAQDVLRKSGKLKHNSHNQYMELALDSGVLRAVLYVLLLLSLYTHPRRKLMEGRLRSNSYAQFVVSVGLAGLASNTVLDSRVLYVVMGCLIGLLVCRREPPRGERLANADAESEIAQTSFMS